MPRRSFRTVLVCIIWLTQVSNKAPSNSVVYLHSLSKTAKSKPSQCTIRLTIRNWVKLTHAKRQICIRESIKKIKSCRGGTAWNICLTPKSKIVLAHPRREAGEVTTRRLNIYYFRHITHMQNKLRPIHQKVSHSPDSWQHKSSV